MTTSQGGSSRRSMSFSSLSTKARKKASENGASDLPQKSLTSSRSMGLTGERTVKRLRLSKALTVPETTSIHEACRRMASRRVDALLLTDSNALLCGILTDKRSYQEYLRVKERYDSLKRLQRNFDGEDLESLTSKELESMERQLHYTLKQIRSTRTQGMLDKLYELQKEEHLLHETNKHLKVELEEGSQMRGLQWDIPSTIGAMYGQQQATQAASHHMQLLHPAAFCETTLQIGYQNDQISGVAAGTSLNNQMQMWPA